MRVLAFFITTPLILFAFDSSTLVHADDTETDAEASFFTLASRYEEAVETFEKTVLKSRGIDRADRSLVNRFDIAAGRLTKAAKKPRSINQLYYRLKDVLKLQAEVEDRFFTKYALNRDLFNCWQRLDFQMILFWNKYVVEVENPNQSNTVQRLGTSNARRNRYFQFDDLPASLRAAPVGTIIDPRFPSDRFSRDTTPQ
ncbi:MAG: hypothetical protein AAGG48_08765 [Planctomycetota bacterium]